MTHFEWQFTEIKRLLVEIHRSRGMRLHGPMDLLDDLKLAIRELEEKMQKMLNEMHDRGIEDGHDDSYDEGYEAGQRDAQIDASNNKPKAS